jgi:hypothetical protein
MIQDIEQIEYRKGMLEKGMKPEALPVKVWRGAEIPADGGNYGTSINKSITLIRL